MLTPDDLAELPVYIQDLFAEYDTFVLQDFARRVAKAGHVTSTAEWQRIRSAEWGASREALTQEEKRILDLAEQGVTNILTDAYTLTNNVDYDRYASVGLNIQRVLNNPKLARYLLAAIKQTNGELRNLTQTQGFVRGKDGNIQESLSQVYIRALDLAQLQVSSGVLDYNTAVKNIIKTVADSGVQTIDYESGYHVNIASAARTATLTGISQMAGNIQDEICDSLNLDLVETSAHAGARPEHAEWQGKIFSRSGKSRKYPNLYEATGLGTPGGLNGPNCRHTYYGYIEGLPRMYTDEELANLDPEPVVIDGKPYTMYQLSQRQRGMERQIRITKRELIAYNEVPELREEFVAASIRLNRQRRRYREFSEQAGLPPRMERTQEYKYGPSISMKAVWANRKGA